MHALCSCLALNAAFSFLNGLLYSTNLKICFYRTLLDRIQHLHFFQYLRVL